MPKFIVQKAMSHIRNKFQTSNLKLNETRKECTAVTMYLEPEVYNPARPKK